MVRHRAVDAARRNSGHARRRASDGGVEHRPAPSSDVPEQLFLQAEADHLHSLLAKIPEAQREVITLAFFGELTHTQIATQLDLPTGTVKGRMRLGLEKLHAHLHGQMGSAR